MTFSDFLIVTNIFELLNKARKFMEINHSSCTLHVLLCHHSVQFKRRSIPVPENDEFLSISKSSLIDVIVISRTSTVCGTFSVNIVRLKME